MCSVEVAKNASSALKRPAEPEVFFPPRKRLRGKTVVFTKLDGPKGFECACGKRYRQEFSDLGPGHGERDMFQTLRLEV